MPKKHDAEYWRNYRKRRRSEAAGVAQPGDAPAPPPATPVVPRPATPQPSAQPRRRRMKSDVEIRNHIIQLIMQHAQNPSALVHLLVGYVTQLQDLMKRDREDELADKVCEHRHPGRIPQGLYCRLCHDAEMAGKFGSLPGQPRPSGDLVYPGEGDDAAGGPDGVDLALLSGVKIKTE